MNLRIFSSRNLMEMLAFYSHISACSSKFRPSMFSSLYVFKLFNYFFIDFRYSIFLQQIFVWLTYRRYFFFKCPCFYQDNATLYIKLSKDSRNFDTVNVHNVQTFMTKSRYFINIPTFLTPPFLDLWRYKELKFSDIVYLKYRQNCLKMSSSFSLFDR